MTYIFEEADRLRNNGKSLEAAKAYLEVAQRHNNPKAKGAAFHMVATSLKEVKDYEQSTDYFEKAIDVYESVGDESNLARVLRDFADQLIDQGKFELANAKFEESEIKLSNGDPGELAMTQVKYAVSLQMSSQVEKADSKVGQALRNVKKSGNTFYLATAYSCAAKISIERGEFSSAVDYLLSGLGSLDLQDEPHNKRRAEILLALEKCFKEIGNDTFAGQAAEQSLGNLYELDEETQNKVKESI